MPKLKKKITRDFTTIHNTMLRDMRLGATERGLLLTMLSLPDNWNFSIKGLSRILPDGCAKIGKALHNLEAAGYLVRRRVYQYGKITEWEYLFSDEPMPNVENPPQETDFQELENLDSGNQDQGNLDQENLHDNQRTNNIVSNNQISTDQASIHQDGPTEREQYSELVKSNICYTEYAEWITLFGEGYMTVAELDEIVAIIVNAIVSEKESDYICGQRFPRSVIRSVMLKVDRGCVERAIETMKHTEHIRNYERYLLSILFNEANGRHLRTNTENRQIDEQLYLLDCFPAADSNSIFAQDAEKLKRKILLHGRTFTDRCDEKVSLYFYENEAEKLISESVLQESTNFLNIRRLFSSVS